MLNNCFLLTFTFFFSCPSAFHFELCICALFQRLLKLGLQTTAIQSVCLGIIVSCLEVEINKGLFLALQTVKYLRSVFKNLLMHLGWLSADMQACQVYDSCHLCISFSSLLSGPRSCCI